MGVVHKWGEILDRRKLIKNTVPKKSTDIQDNE